MSIYIVRSGAPAIVSSFAGTISAASLTATFTQAADYALCVIGSTIISNAQTRYVTKLLGASQVTLDQTTTWAASSAITSIQGPQQVSDLSGTIIYFKAANGTPTFILTSDGSILDHLTVDGKRGIGTTGPGMPLHVYGASDIADQLYFNTILAASNAYNSGYAKAGISFQAKYNAAGAVATLAGISGGKENTTDDNYASFLGLYTRANGGNTTEQVRISSAGNVGIATTDLDGTPAVGRLTVKGTTNDGTTQVQVWRDSDEANVANLNTNGDFYVAADVSALTFTDRTSAFEGDALAAIMAIKSVDGELDHSTLHPFAQKTIVKRQNKFTTEVSVEDAFETVDVEEDEMEEITDENGEAKKQPIILSSKMVQKGFKVENNQVVPNMVEEKVTKKINKQVARQKASVKFDEKTGKFFMREVEIIETPGRSIGAMISILTKAIQELQEKLPKGLQP